MQVQPPPALSTDSPGCLERPTEDAVSRTLKTRFACLRILVAPVCLFYLIFVVGGNFLHDQGYILGAYDFHAEYHYEAYFATSRHYLEERGPVEMICTGDSRVGTGIDPAQIDALSCHNLSCGSQTLPLTSGIILDTLDHLQQRPRYLLIGITPDYLSVSGVQDDSTRVALENYQRGELFRTQASAPRKLVQKHLPLVFYRHEVLHDLRRMKGMFKGEAPPTSVHGFELTERVSWRRYQSFHFTHVSKDGWWRENLGPYVAGEFPPSHSVRERLRSPYQADVAGLQSLIDNVRERDIEPVLVFMPFHESFYRVHDSEIPERMMEAVSQVTRRSNVLVLVVPFDMSDEKNWYDGHHFSVSGAEKFSKELNRQLRAAVEDGRLTAGREK